MSTINNFRTDQDLVESIGDIFNSMTVDEVKFHIEDYWKSF